MPFKSSEGFEEDLPDILKRHTLPTKFSMDNSTITTTTITTKETIKKIHENDFVSSRKINEIPVFSSTTASDEDVFEGFPHRYAYLNNEKTDSHHPQKNPLYLNLSDSALQNSDPTSVAVTDNIPNELPIINE